MWKLVHYLIYFFGFSVLLFQPCFPQRESSPTSTPRSAGHYNTTPRVGGLEGGRLNQENVVSGGDSPEDKDVDLEKDCSVGESHTIIDLSSSCCNHNIVLVHGLDLRKYWVECARPLSQNASKPSELIEDYINSTRRVYMCILSKSLREPSVSLLNFADMMSTKYPAEIRTAIIAKVKTFNSSREMRSLDYDSVRDVRNNFFAVQRQVCNSMDTKRRRNDGRGSEGNQTDGIRASETTWTNRTIHCDEYEEAEHNGGTCCRGKSVPLDLDYWRPPLWRTRMCNVTLAEQFRRWKIRSSDRDAALEICNEACRLQQDNPKGSRFLESTALNDFRDVSAHIRKVLPSYFSQYMIGVVQNYSRQHYSHAVNENEIVKKYGIDTDTVKVLKPCIAFKKLSDTIFDALHEYCFPSDHKNDMRIQSAVYG